MQSAAIRKAAHGEQSESSYLSSMRLRGTRNISPVFLHFLGSPKQREREQQHVQSRSPMNCQRRSPADGREHDDSVRYRYQRRNEKQSSSEPAFAAPEKSKEEQARDDIASSLDEKESQVVRVRKGYSKSAGCELWREKESNSDENDTHCDGQGEPKERRAIRKLPHKNSPSAGYLDARPQSAYTSACFVSQALFYSSASSTASLANPLTAS